MAELDQDRIEKLMGAILVPVHQNYVKGPMNKDRVYEALNALAAATAILLSGVDDSGYAFYIEALHQHLADAQGRQQHEGLN